MKKEMRSFIGFMLGPLGAAAIGFITTPIITYFIAPEEYAKVNLYQMFQNILSVLIYFGFDQAYVRFFYEERDKNKLWNNSAFIPFIVGCIVSIGIMTNISNFSMYLFTNNKILFPTILLCISVPLIITERFLLLWLRMQEKSFLYSLFNVILKILILGLTVFLMLYYQKSYLSAIYGTVVGQIVFDIILLIICIRMGTNINIKTLDGHFIQKLAKYGLPLAPVTVISMILNSADRFAIKEFSTMEDLGLYAVALKITGLLAILKNCITTFWVPMSLRWYSEGKDNLYFFKVTEIVTGTMSIVCLISFFIKEFIFRLFDAQYINAQYIFPMLMFYPILYTISETFIIGITFRKKGYIITIISIVTLIVDILLNLYFVPKFGAIGAAAATALSNIVYFVGILYYSRKIWYKFPCKKIIISLVILCLAVGLNVSIRSMWIYVWNILLIIVLISVFKNGFYETVKMLHSGRKKGI